MRRGEIWSVSARGYAGKPRPAVILQDDRFADNRSVTICLFTTNAAEAPLFRLPVAPTGENGLREPCRLMVDKIMTVSRTQVGARIGRLEDAVVQQLNRAVLVFLGLGKTRGQTARAPIGSSG